MNALEKLRKNTTSKKASILSESELLLEKDVTSTPVYAMNVALSGDINGGLTSGVTIFAGESKHFKSTFALLLAESYLRKHEDAVLLFYDNEFGSPVSYFESIGINPDRVFHTPIETVEDLKHDISCQLKGLERGDKVIIIIDSLGNVASNKETEDAIDGKTVADMTRAKAIKSLFRIVNVQLTIKNIPLVAIAHTYDTQEMYSKKVVSGGKGIYYSADNIYIIGRNQEKDGTEVVGYNFIINVEKSRFVREKSKIPITVSYDKGINIYSGLMDIALELGYVTKPKQGWYAKVDKDTGTISETNYRFAQTNNKEFWDNILSNQKFREDIIAKFKIANGSLISKEDDDVDYSSDFEEDDQV